MKHITNKDLQRLQKAMLPYLSVSRKKEVVKSITEDYLRKLIKCCSNQNKETVALYLAFKGLFRDCDSLLWQDTKGSWNLFTKTSFSYKYIKSLRRHVGL